MNGLFDIEDKIILYDLTDTCYENRMSGSLVIGYRYCDQIQSGNA
jgi:hypothetical protein